MTESKQWLTPKSQSLELFVSFVARVLVALALVAATVAGSLTAASATALLAAVAVILSRD